MKKIISSDKAPRAIGTYSQAVKVGDTVYLSGQIPLVPETMELLTGNVEEQIHRVFKNLAAVAERTGQGTDAHRVHRPLPQTPSTPSLHPVTACREKSLATL